VVTGNSSIISNIRGREIIDSRGNPTVEVTITTRNDDTVTSSVPSGASTGLYEAVELRDCDVKRYRGKGVLQAVNNINTIISNAIIGIDSTDQRLIDETLIKIDGTDNKANLGANAILGVSLAASKAGAKARGVSLWKHYSDLAGNPAPYTLPVPCFNVINGGEHAGNKLAFQEFFIIPIGANTFREAMLIGCEIFHSLRSTIKMRFGGNATLIGDEGGFAPPCDIESGLQMLMEATEKAGYLNKVSIGLDVASSEFKVRNKNKYDLDFKTPDDSPEKDHSLCLSANDLVSFYKSIIDKYPIVTIEDPFDQDDWTNWTKLCSDVGEKVQIVGDDLTVTNPVKIQEAIDKRAANCLLLKVNQIGSISESIDAVKLSKLNGWGVMTSHRSGETEDSYIADLAVGLGTGQIKTGAPCRGERTAKYNQLLRIEEEMGDVIAQYAGVNFRKPLWMGRFNKTD